MDDSLYIGKPIQFILTYRHAPETDVFFPDTTYKFSPFEVQGRAYFPTVTNTKGSLDSVVYTLMSFDVNPVQKLTLPVFIRNGRDCTAVFSDIDSVFLHQAISDVSGKQYLKNTMNLLPIATNIDYLKTLLGLGFVVFLTMIGYVIFGNRIKKQLLLFRLYQKHQDFLKHYRKLMKQETDSEQIGEILTLWKSYIEQLQGLSYQSFTTKEIIEHLPDERLEQSLRELDTATYGGVLSVNTPAAIRFLKQKAIEIYNDERSKY